MELSIESIAQLICAVDDTRNINEVQAILEDLSVLITDDIIRDQVFSALTENGTQLAS